MNDSSKFWPVHSPLQTLYFRMHKATLVFHRLLNSAIGGNIRSAKQHWDWKPITDTSWSPMLSNLLCTLYSYYQTLPLYNNELKAPSWHVIVNPSVFPFNHSNIIKKRLASQTNRGVPDVYRTHRAMVCLYAIAYYPSLFEYRFSGQQLVVTPQIERHPFLPFHDPIKGGVGGQNLIVLRMLNQKPRRRGDAPNSKHSSASDPVWGIIMPLMILNASYSVYESSFQCPLRFGATRLLSVLLRQKRTVNQGCMHIDSTDLILNR